MSARKRHYSNPVCRARSAAAANSAKRVAFKRAGAHQYAADGHSRGVYIEMEGRGRMFPAFGGPRCVWCGSEIVRAPYPRVYYLATWPWNLAAPDPRPELGPYHPDCWTIRYIQWQLSNHR